MDQFHEKIVVVAGAAGNLGKAVVRAILKADGIVIGIDHRKDRMEEIFQFTSDKAQFYPRENVDVTNTEAVLGLSEEIFSSFGKVDVLVNTVGAFSMDSGVHDFDRKTFQRMMGLNVYSFLNLSKAFVPQMIKKGYGKVISIGAKASLKGSAKMGAYAASKAALLRLNESLASELKSKNIQVNCILPGTLDTPQNRMNMPNADYSKWVSPDEVADVILFLASPNSDAVSGAAIPVFGGV